MGQIKFTVSSEVEEEFRKKAAEEYGLNKGSLSKAGEEALQDWISDEGTQSQDITELLERTRGMLSHVDASAEELENSVGQMKYDEYKGEMEEYK